MQETRKLTPEEQAFAAEHHHLVSQFLKDKRLSEDEYYDVIIFRYLHAVQLYLERPWLAKYSFKTIAYQNMRSALGHHYAAQMRKKRYASVLSLDMPLWEGSSLSLSDTVAQSGAVYDFVEMREVWEHVAPVITPRQMQALRLRAQGFTHRETGELCGISASGVSSRIYRLRKKAKERLSA